MATNNFVEFDSAKTDIQSDAEYLADTQRVNGVSTGLARTIFHNKLYRQLSVMAAAIGQVIADLGQNASDSSLATLVTAFKSTILAAANHTLATATSSRLGVSNVDAALYNIPEISSKVNWKLIQSYTVAGTYTFTAPDFFAGASYTIGAIVEGGGGSGGACVVKHSSNTVYPNASGGASGVRAMPFTLTVTPGSQYTVVVGAGGAAVVATVSAIANAVATGNAGGSSSFNGITAPGGNGGLGVYNSTAGGVSGGIGSDSQANGTKITLPTPLRRIMNSLNTIADYINPFDPSEVSLMAGGGVSAQGSAALTYVQDLSSGLSVGVGSQGVAACLNETQSTNRAYSAVAPTSPACGGGGCVADIYGSNATYSLSATSAKGADGRVAIYARKVV